MVLNSHPLKQAKPQKEYLPSGYHGNPSRAPSEELGSVKMPEWLKRSRSLGFCWQISKLEWRFASKELVDSAPYSLTAAGPRLMAFVGPGKPCLSKTANSFEKNENNHIGP